MGQRQRQKRIGTYFELNENENTTHKNLWNVGKTILKDKPLTLNAYIRKEKWSQISDLTSTLLEKKYQVEYQAEGKQ